MSTTYYTYDASGRLTQQHTDAGATTPQARYYRYNERSMVTRIDHAKTSGKDANRYFAYNTFGDRVTAYDGGAQHGFQLDGQELLRDKLGGGTFRYNHDGKRDSLASIQESLEGLRGYAGTAAAGNSIDASVDAPTIVGTSRRVGHVPGFGLGTHLGVGRHGSVNTVLLEELNEPYISQDFSVFGETLYSLDGIGGSPANKAWFGVDLGLVKLDTSLPMYAGPGGSLYFPGAAMFSSISKLILALVGPFPPGFARPPKATTPEPGDGLDPFGSRRLYSECEVGPPRLYAEFGERIDALDTRMAHGTFSELVSNALNDPASRWAPGNAINIVPKLDRVGQFHYVDPKAPGRFSFGFVLFVEFPIRDPRGRCCIQFHESRELQAQPWGEKKFGGQALEPEERRGLVEDDGRGRWLMARRDRYAADVEGTFDEALIVLDIPGFWHPGPLTPFYRGLSRLAMQVSVFDKISRSSKQSVEIRLTQTFTNPGPDAKVSFELWADLGVNLPGVSVPLNPRPLEDDERFPLVPDPPDVK